MLAAFAADPERCERWEDRLWERLAYVARYGHTPPEQAIHMEMRDLRKFGEKLSEIVKEENKAPSSR